MKDFFSRHGGRLFRRRRRLFRLLLGGLRGGLLGLLGPGIGLLLLGMGPCGDELGRYVLVVAVEEGVLGGELLSLFLSELNSFLDLFPPPPPKQCRPPPPPKRRAFSRKLASRSLLLSQLFLPCLTGDVTKKTKNETLEN